LTVGECVAAYRAWMPRARRQGDPCRGWISQCVLLLGSWLAEPPLPSLASLLQIVPAGSVVQRSLQGTHTLERPRPGKGSKRTFHRVGSNEGVRAFSMQGIFLLSIQRHTLSHMLPVLGVANDSRYRKTPPFEIDPASSHLFKHCVYSIFQRLIAYDPTKLLKRRLRKRPRQSMASARSGNKHETGNMVVRANPPPWRGRKIMYLALTCKMGLTVTPCSSICPRGDARRGCDGASNQCRTKTRSRTNGCAGRA